MALDPDTFSSSSIFSDRKQSYNKPNLSKDFFDPFAVLITKTFLPCHGNGSRFSIRIKVGDINVEVDGKGVTSAPGVAF